MNLDQSNHSSRPNPGCPRCQGLLVPTLLQVDPFDGREPSFPTAWRCANCGALLDLQILMNRSSTLEKPTYSGDQVPRLKPRRARGGPRVRLPLIPRRYTSSD